MNKHCTLFVLIGALCLLVSFTDTSPMFSKDRSAFFEELHAFLNTKKDKEKALLINSVQVKIASGDLGEIEFEQMVDICNRMKSLNLKPVPYYSNYLLGISKAESEAVSDWHHLVLNLLKTIKPGKPKSYHKFLEFSKHFFETGHLRFSKSGVSWNVEQKDFQMIWKDGEPIFDFEKIGLTAQRKGAKMQIINASGSYFPLENEWVGRGGKVTWERLDDDTEISANLLDYEIDFSKNEYIATKAYLIFPKYFENKTIEGRFHDKLLIGNKSKEASFPRFQSKSGGLNLKNIAPGVTFTGGMKIEGLTITGYNPEGEEAELEYIPDSPSVKSKFKAAFFSIKKSGEIVASQASASLYFGQDSLFHPSTNLKLIPGKKMVLYSNDKSASKAPFFDSRQQTYFYSKKIEWDISKNKILVNPTGGGDRSVEFESEHFYDKNYVHRIQNVANHQPIILLYLMSKSDGSTIDAKYFAKRLNPNFDISNIKTLLFDLERHGFFKYSTKTQELFLTDKVAHYAESHGERKDFDILKIVSESGETNAVYDLEKEAMNIGGVQKVILQNRQKVSFKPTDEQLLLKKNREMDFDGKIYSGLINLTGKHCHFDYEKFMVKVDSLEFFDIYMPSDSTYEFEDQKSYGIGSRIEKTSGYLLINAPDNKSGKEELEDYPAFQSESPSYVYYNTENKQGEDVYKKDQFFFQLDPFVLKNLAKPKPSDLNFKGQLVSGGIFPAFKETLTLQPDQSLGFVAKTPDAGFAIYGETGNFEGEINLSNEGLLGKGDLNYEGTQIQSENLVFQPRKVTGSAETFHLEEDKENSVPEVRGFDVKIDWKPYTDSMVVESKEKSFQLFNEGEHEIGGVLISTPDGLKGRGIFQWGEGEMGAKLFDFGAHAVESEKTNLKIKSLDTDALAFDTKDLKGSIDFDTQKGQFKSNDETSMTKMPANHFVTSLNEFEWDLGKKALSFVAGIGKKGDFISTHPDQDSLIFKGTAANYDFESGLLKIEGVENMEVADAYISPDKKKIEVETGGYLTKLENATIVANRANNYHKFTNATVTILGKSTYEAKGFYEYKVGELVQSIEFTNISGRKRGKGKRSEKIASTQAQKSIAETDKFRLNSKTFFYGAIDLVATDPNLQFTGYSKLDASVLTKPHWFRVDFKGDKNNLLIESNKPKNPEGFILHTGIYMDKETRSNYANVLMPLRSKEDRCLFDANGVFQFNDIQNRFILGNKDAMNHYLAKGNVLHFSQKNAKITAIGSFNVCPNIRGAKIELAGIAKTGLAIDKLSDPSLSDKNLSGKFATKLDFLIPKPLMSIIEKDFLFYKDSVRSLRYENGELYRTAVKEWVDNPNIKNKAISKINIDGHFKIKERKKPSSFILGELDMKWHSAKQSFVTVSDSIALISINGEEYNKKVKGIVVFNTPSNEDDRVYVMLRTPGNKYYYFNYKKGILHVQSNNPEFNDKVKSMKIKDLTHKIKGGDTYEIQLTTGEIVGGFRRNVEAWQNDLSKW